MIALFGSTLTWISELAVARSLLTLSRSGCVLRAAMIWSVAGLDLGRVGATDDDADRAAAGHALLGDLDRPAVGLQLGELVVELELLGVEIDAVVEPGDDRGRVGGTAGEGGRDRREAGVGVARHGGLDEIDFAVGLRAGRRPSWPCPRTSDDGVPEGGATLTWRNFCRAGVEELRGDVRDEEAGHDDQGGRDADDAPAARGGSASASLQDRGVDALDDACRGARAPSSGLSLMRSMKRLARTGTTVRAQTSDASRAKVTVSAKGRKNWLTRPPTKPSGRKTATVVSVELVMALATSRVPEMTASRIESPRPRWR